MTPQNHAWGRRFNRGHNRLFLTRDLHFNIQISRAPEARQDVFQTRKGGATALEALRASQSGILRSRDLTTSELWIVPERATVVAGETHVELETVATARQGVLECGKTVLGRCTRPAQTET